MTLLAVAGGAGFTFQKGVERYDDYLSAEGIYNGARNLKGVITDKFTFDDSNESASSGDGEHSDSEFIKED